MIAIVLPIMIYLIIGVFLMLAINKKEEDVSKKDMILIVVAWLPGLICIGFDWLRDKINENRK